MLSIPNAISRQIIQTKDKISELNYTVNYRYMQNIHPKDMGCKFFSVADGTFFKTGLLVVFKESLNKYKGINKS